jgi:hypothetical protein
MQTKVKKMIEVLILKDLHSNELFDLNKNRPFSDNKLQRREISRIIISIIILR